MEAAEYKRQRLQLKVALAEDVAILQDRRLKSGCAKQTPIPFVEKVEVEEVARALGATIIGGHVK